MPTYAVEGIWCVSTIRANHMLGSNKLLKTENQLKGLGRSSIDWRVDANSGTIAIRWYDNIVVQLASTYIGHEQGNKVKRWSAKENGTIEIEWLRSIDHTWGALTFATCCLPCTEFD